MKNLIRSLWLTLFLFSNASFLFSQSTQTIRGTIVDDISRIPIPGVSVLIQENAKFGNVSSVDGQYRIDNVPVGRYTILVSYLGYQTRTIPNVMVTAGKEVIINFNLTEVVSILQEVVITADPREDKVATNNEFSIVSVRSFNLDDTKRYAGALGDPSRMAANFAGVVGGNDSRNDIVVRGNSPTGMLWQLEGLNIPNPNHFGALVATGGPVSILNNNNLDKSDFMTSAFTAQYGNAIAGVFDIRLRDGNEEKTEVVTQMGFNGLEFGAEGPIKKSSGSSFIVNYRYSTLALFQNLGIQFGTGSNTPYYQDINFKLTVPTAKKGKFTFFGMGGSSKIDLLGSEADLEGGTDLYGSENTDGYPRFRAGVIGISYEKSVSENTFVKVTAGTSATREFFHSDSLVRDSENEVIARYKNVESQFDTRKFSLNLLTRTKFNRKNSLITGFSADASLFELFNQEIFANTGREFIRLDADGNATLYQAYATWRHRFTNYLSFNAGLHSQYYSLNKEIVAEPRASLQYNIGGKHSLSAGYGLHHQTQNITTSFFQSTNELGEMIETNLDLDFTRSQHFVVTYDWNFSENVRLKAETYYQNLSMVPVEQRPTAFSALNTGVAFGPSEEDSLTNKGSGKNYGLELTLERFYSKGLYYLLTASVFNSKYKGSDGIERNTAFNTNYVMNLLAGKEWKMGSKNQFLSAGLKVTAIGGKFLTPIDIPKSTEIGTTVFDDARAFSERQDAYFRMDLKFSYRKEFLKTTLEVAIDLQNVTNNENVFARSYNARTNSIVTQYQQSFFPVPYVRFTF